MSSLANILITRASSGSSTHHAERLTQCGDNQEASRLPPETGRYLPAGAQ